MQGLAYGQVQASMVVLWKMCQWRSIGKSCIGHNGKTERQGKTQKIYWINTNTLENLASGITEKLHVKAKHKKYIGNTRINTDTLENLSPGITEKLDVKAKHPK